MTVAAVSGGTIGGQLGADTLFVGGNLSSAQVLMSNASDPN